MLFQRQKWLQQSYRFFLCRGKQKWLLCFMLLHITGIMVSYMLDGANYIALLQMFPSLPQMRRWVSCLYNIFYDSGKGCVMTRKHVNIALDVLCRCKEDFEPKTRRQEDKSWRVCTYPPIRRDNQLWVAWSRTIAQALIHQSRCLQSYKPQDCRLYSKQTLQELIWIINTPPTAPSCLCSIEMSNRWTQAWNDILNILIDWFLDHRFSIMTRDRVLLVYIAVNKPDFHNTQK